MKDRARGFKAVYRPTTPIFNCFQEVLERFIFVVYEKVIRVIQ